jgi:hypothetical protein
LIVGKDPILLETEIFNYREVKPHFINACCFGEDFAEWMRMHLLRILENDFRLSNIIQEDWGWGFWARKGKDPFWIGVGHISNCDQQSPAQWMVFVECDYGINVFKRLFYRPNEAALAHLQLKVRQVLESDPGIRMLPA